MEALSYAWGPPDPSQYIEINEHSLRVSQNLFDYLVLIGCEQPMWHMTWERYAYFFIDQIKQTMPINRIRFDKWRICIARQTEWWLG
jgi:hypothetical protein